MTVQGAHEEFLRNEANGKNLNDLDRHRIDAREHGKTFYGTNPIDDPHPTTVPLGAFAARRRTVERIGLPAVRYHRLAQLEREEQTWRDQSKRQAEVSPDLVPLLLLRLEGGTSGG